MEQTLLLGGHTEGTETYEKMFRRVEDGGEIGGSDVHFPSMPMKYLADMRSRVNSQQYSSIYEDWRPKIGDQR